MRKLPGRINFDQQPANQSQDIDIKLPRDINQKMEMLKPYIERNGDIICRNFVLRGTEGEVAGAAIYVEGMVDANSLHQDILRPLMLYEPGENQKNPNSFIDYICQTSLMVGQVKKADKFSAVIDALFDDLTVLMFDGFAEAIIIDIRNGEMRSVTEPLLDKTICGPREGFVENLVVNISLVRRKLRDPNLVVEKTKVGKRTRNDVAILYIEDIADPAIVTEIKNRINKIDIDGIVCSGYVNQLIEDNPYTVFPLTRMIERTEIVVAELLEGRIAVIVNESPIVLVYPALFIEMFQAAEDYCEKVLVGSFWRIIRFVAFFIAIFLPATYIALLSFHQDSIPFELFMPIAQARAQVPFPVLVETIIMEVIIQLIIEAGLRLPPSLGQTIGVVSGIILGQAAIAAKLASPEMIIVIAITTISTFAIPNFCMVAATRVLRIGMIFLAAVFGLFGMSLGLLLMVAHLVSLESIGVPYMSPLAPTRYKDLKDSIFRILLKNLKDRPVSIPHQDPRRQGNM